VAKDQRGKPVSVRQRLDVINKHGPKLDAAAEALLAVGEVNLARSVQAVAFEMIDRAIRIANAPQPPQNGKRNGK